MEHRFSSLLRYRFFAPFIRVHFASGTDGSQTANINVPFALLNLILDSPLTSTPTPYFPCSPWTSSADAPYHLGRAFLQAAFLGANSHKLFLAQAPGPDHLSQNVKKIASTDSAITPGLDALDLGSTWAGTLNALTSTSNSTGPGSSNGTSSSNGGSQTSANGFTNVQTGDLDTGISKGALVGIVAAGVLRLVGTAFALWYFWVYKRRQQRKQVRQNKQALLPPEYTSPALWGAKDPDPPSTPELVGSPQQYQLQDFHSSDKGYVPIAELHANLHRPSQLRTPT